MAAKHTSKGRGSTTKREKTARASVTFPSDVYRTVEQIAKQKKVSFAWVVREATEKYVADQWPLLEGTQREPPR